MEGRRNKRDIQTLGIHNKITMPYMPWLKKKIEAYIEIEYVCVFSIKQIGDQNNLPICLLQRHVMTGDLRLF